VAAAAAGQDWQQQRALVVMVAITAQGAAVEADRLTGSIQGLAVQAGEVSVVSSVTRYALIDESNRITSVVLWDGVSDWGPPAGFTAMLESEAIASGLVFAQNVPDVPEVITCVQGRLALLQAGMLDAVESSISAASRDVQIFWEFATEWHRTNSVLISLGQSLGLSDAQVDALFRLAKGL